MRLQEILNLKPHNIHFDHLRFGSVGAIEVIATKVDRSKTIPLTPAVRDVLRRRCEGLDSTAFIFSFNGISRVAAQLRVERAMRSVSEELKIPYGRFTAGGCVNLP